MGGVVAAGLLGRGKLPAMRFTLEFDREVDGRWIAEVVELPGVIAYGATEQEAGNRVQALALRVLADRIEHGEMESGMLNVQFLAA